MIPDVDHFQGHAGGRAIPLYRDTLVRVPNVAPKLVDLLGQILKVNIEDDDVMAYVAAVVAHPGFAARFSDNLRQPGVRVPLTATRRAWERAVELGKQIIWLHTFGERPTHLPEDWVQRWARDVVKPRVHVPIPGRREEMPENIDYDDEDQMIKIGEGRMGPVSRRVWEYEISDMRIIRHWFDYRRATPKFSPKGTDLDRINACSWTRAKTEELRHLIAILERCVALEKMQDGLLNDIVTGSLVSVDDLEAASVLPLLASANEIIDNDPEGKLT